MIASSLRAPVCCSRPGTRSPLHGCVESAEARRHRDGPCGGAATLAASGHCSAAPSPYVGRRQRLVPHHTCVLGHASHGRRGPWRLTSRCCSLLGLRDEAWLSPLLLHQIRGSSAAPVAPEAAPSGCRRAGGSAPMVWARTRAPCRAEGREPGLSTSGPPPPVPRLQSAAGVAMGPERRSPSQQAPPRHAGASIQARRGRTR